MIVGFNLHKIEFNIVDVVIARSEITLPYCTICANHELIVSDKNIKIDRLSNKKTITYSLKDIESDVIFPNMQGDYFSLKVNLKEAQNIHYLDVDKKRLFAIIERSCSKRKVTVSDIDSSIKLAFCNNWFKKCEPTESCVFFCKKERCLEKDIDFISSYKRSLKIKKIKEKIKDEL